MNIRDIKKSLLKIVLEAKMTSRNELIKVMNSKVEVKKERVTLFMELAARYFEWVNKRSLTLEEYQAGNFIDSVYNDILNISSRDIIYSNLYYGIKNSMDAILEAGNSFDKEAIQKELDNIKNLASDVTVMATRMANLLEEIKKDEDLLNAKNAVLLEEVKRAKQRIEEIISDSNLADDSEVRAQLEVILSESKRARTIASDGNKVKAKLLPTYEALLTKLVVPTSDGKLVRAIYKDEYEKCLELANRNLIGDENIKAQKEEYSQLQKKLETLYCQASDKQIIRREHLEKYESLLAQSKQELVTTSDGKLVTEESKEDYEELLFALSLHEGKQELDSVDRVLKCIEDCMNEENKSNIDLDSTEKSLFEEVKRKYKVQNKTLADIFDSPVYPRLEATNFVPNPEVIYLGGKIADAMELQAIEPLPEEEDVVLELPENSGDALKEEAKTGEDINQASVISFSSDYGAALEEKPADPITQALPAKDKEDDLPLYEKGVEDLLQDLGQFTKSVNHEILEENKSVIERFTRKVEDLKADNIDGSLDVAISLFEYLICLFKRAHKGDNLTTLADNSKIRTSDFLEYKDTYDALIEESRKSQEKAKNDGEEDKKNNDKGKHSGTKGANKGSKRRLFGGKKKNKAKDQSKKFGTLFASKINNLTNKVSNVFKNREAKIVFATSAAVCFALPLLITAVLGTFKNNRNNKASAKTISIESKNNNRRISASIPSSYLDLMSQDEQTMEETWDDYFTMDASGSTSDLDIEVVEPEPVDPRVESMARASEGPDEYFYGLSIEEKIEYVLEAFSISYQEFNEICYNQVGTDLYYVLNPYREAINNEMIPVILEREGLSENQLDIVASTVSHEAGQAGGYAEAYGVSSTFLNRINDVAYVRSHGTSVYSQCTARNPDQFDSYCGGYYRQYLEVKCIAKQAFYDAMYSKTTIHDWKSFRGKNVTSYSDNRVTSEGNRYAEIFTRYVEYTDEDAVKDDYFRTLFGLYDIMDNIHYEGRSR